MECEIDLGVRVDLLFPVVLDLGCEEEVLVVSQLALDSVAVGEPVQLALGLSVGFPHHAPQRYHEALRVLLHTLAPHRHRVAQPNLYESTWWTFFLIF